MIVFLDVRRYAFGEMLFVCLVASINDLQSSLDPLPVFLKKFNSVFVIVVIKSDFSEGFSKHLIFLFEIVNF